MLKLYLIVFISYDLQELMNKGTREKDNCQGNVVFKLYVDFKLVIVFLNIEF